jgi:hypothetical protein
MLVSPTLFGLTHDELAEEMRAKAEHEERAAPGESPVDPWSPRERICGRKPPNLHLKTHWTYIGQGTEIIQARLRLPTPQASRV